MDFDQVVNNPVGIIYFRARFTSFRTRSYLFPSSSHYLISLLMFPRECSGKHSCTNSPFPISYSHTEYHLLFFASRNSTCFGRSFAYQNLMIYYINYIGSYWPSRLLSFVPALLFFTTHALFIPSSSVYLCYFILGVPMHKCLGKQSCNSSPFPIAILNGTSFFSLVRLRETKHAKPTL